MPLQSGVAELGMDSLLGLRTRPERVTLAIPRPSNISCAVSFMSWACGARWSEFCSEKRQRGNAPLSFNHRIEINVVFVARRKSPKAPMQRKRLGLAHT